MPVLGTQRNKSYFIVYDIDPTWRSRAGSRASKPCSVSDIPTTSYITACEAPDQVDPDPELQRGNRRHPRNTAIRLP